MELGKLIRNVHVTSKSVSNALVPLVNLRLEHSPVVDECLHLCLGEIKDFVLAQVNGSIHRSLRQLGIKLDLRRCRSNVLTALFYLLLEVLDQLCTLLDRLLLHQIALKNFLIFQHLVIMVPGVLIPQFLYFSFGLVSQICKAGVDKSLGLLVIV